MNILNGEIYWMENPNALGHEYLKKRPYLVVDSNEFIKVNTVVCTVPLSTKPARKGNYDVLIPKDPNNNLNYDSTAKINHLCAFDKTRLKRIIGIVDPIVMRSISEKLVRRFSW